MTKAIETGRLLAVIVNECVANQLSCFQATNVISSIHDGVLPQTLDGSFVINQLDKE